VSRVFVTGGSGVVGGALVDALCERGDEVIALARSDAARDELERRGARVLRGDILEADVLARGMEGCATLFHVAGQNSLCVEDPSSMLRANIEGPAVAIRAAAQAGVGRVVHTSSAATIGEPEGTIGREDTPHRGWFLSTYERSKTEGERVALETGRQEGVDVISVNPCSVQGPGRAGGTARFLLAFLDGRLKLFVDTHVSLVDIKDCTAGHLLAAERGTPGERYILSGVTFTISEAFALAGGRARIPARAPPPAGVPGDGADADPRAPLRRLPGGARARVALHRPTRDDPTDGHMGARGGTAAERVRAR
jgi:dihydroflavonol-4-reductase